MRRLKSGDKLLINSEAAQEFISRDWGRSGGTFYDGWNKGDILVISRKYKKNAAVNVEGSGIGTHVNLNLVHKMRRAYLMQSKEQKS